MESLTTLYEGCRSYRRFRQMKIPLEILKQLVDTAGKRSSAMNAQVLRYAIVHSPENVRKVQPCLHWAAKLPKEIGTPKEDEQPAAFIVVLIPEKSTVLAGIDAGIALDTMAVTAWQKGIGSCIINNVDRVELSGIIHVPEGMAAGPVLALGYPACTSTIVEPDPVHGLSYYVDENRNYYVPKRSLDEIAEYY